MKKLNLNAIALLTCLTAISVCQTSCTKTANSQTPSYTLLPATTSRLGGVIPDGTSIAVDMNGKISAISSAAQQEGKLLYGVFGATESGNAIWTSNFDGTNAKKINITMPNGIVIDPGNVRLSPDHKTIFFSAHTISPAALTFYLYSTNSDGSGLRQIQNVGPNGGMVGVAY